MTTYPSTAARRRPSRTTLLVLGVAGAATAVLLTVDAPSLTPSAVPAQPDVRPSVSTYVEDFYYEPGAAATVETAPPASTYVEDPYFAPGPELGSRAGDTYVPRSFR